MSVVVDASGIANLELIFERFPEAASRAMSIAINTTVNDFVLPEARKDILAEVAFPDGYLDSSDKLGVRQYATPQQLMAVVEARSRPTSLARFVDAPAIPAIGARGPPGNVTVNVTVKPGVTTSIKRGFFVGLNSDNIGFAVRLRPGEPFQNFGKSTFQPIEIFKSEDPSKGRVFLLYGPSVDQVFRQVADVIAPETEVKLEAEFTRVLAVTLGVNK